MTVEALAPMRLKSGAFGPARSEAEVYASLVPMANARVLELGCGKADVLRRLAGEFPDSRFLALEVDALQGALNAKSEAPGNLVFGTGGAEAIPAIDDAFDAVLMLKSLHHVPRAELDRALHEIHRVLRPGGLALFSEPVFAGEYNEVIRSSTTRRKCARSPSTRCSAPWPRDSSPSRRSCSSRAW